MVKRNYKIIIAQILLITIVLIGVIIFYPRASIGVNGNFVRFNSINADVIVISTSPDFTNPRYIQMNESKNFSLDLKPGKYYWKSYNKLIEGFSGDFEVLSKVGLSINHDYNLSGLVNIGNVKVNVSKLENGMLVGRIILDPNDQENIDDKKEQYIGRQE